MGLFRILILWVLNFNKIFLATAKHFARQCTKSESTKQMEQTLRAKVKIFFKSENLNKKMLLIKNDGLIGFI
jgi:hypothetical protein